MEKDRIDVVEDRVRGLERRLELMDYRLRTVEAWRAGGSAPSPIEREEPVPAREFVVPPPIQIPAPRPPAMAPVAAAPSIAPAQAAREQDTEYVIGAKVLPKIGAGVVLLAVIYFMQLGFTNGWITPWMIFWSAILFCLAFVGVGLWKRAEREQYGQILTGIGTCGLYITFAAGYAAQRLYEGETLVTCFMILSFLNLLYGLASRSRAFLAIGILGGFVAAMMPMKEYRFALDATLHLAIVVPAALIAARRRWVDMAVWLFVFSTGALMPLLNSGADWQLRMAALFASTLIATAAHAYAYEKTSFDPEAVFGPAAIVLTGIFGLALHPEPAASLYVLGLGAAAVSASLLAPAGSAARPRMVVGGIAVAAVLVPFFFSPVQCIGMFLGLSVAASALAAARIRGASVFAALEFLLAIGSYAVVEASRPLAYQPEAWLLAGAIIAAVAVAFSSVRSGSNAQLLTMLAMAVIMPLFGRFGVLILTGTTLAPTVMVSIVEALLVFAAGSVAISSITRWASALVAMWASFGIALMAYAVAAEAGEVLLFHDSLLLVGLIVVALAGVPVALGTAAVDFRKPIAGIAVVMVGLLSMRLAYVLASMPGSSIDPRVAACVCAALYSIGSSGFALARKSDVALSAAWSLFAAAGSVYLLEGEIKVRAEMPIISAILAAFLLGVAALRRTAIRQPELWHAVALVGWIVFSRWVDVSLVLSGFDLRDVSTLTIAWIVYAVGLLGSGFGLDVRQLRYWSFGVMGVTTFKILAVDLASTPIPVRVGVLLGLGLLMLGGGYWYIKGRHAPAT